MNSTEAVVAVGLLASAVMMALAFLLVFWVLLVIAHWRMFTKAGEKGWKSIIPIYSDYVLFKLAWNTKSFWIWLGLGALTVITTALSGQYAITVNGELVITGTSNMFMGTVSFVASIASMVWSAMLCLRTALAYGKLPSFGIGLLLLPNIFSMILGFGSAEYKGPQE
ncbi:MAG: hypothetical protein J6S63_09365 [Atopobiaceae bacterium]|nr:hypothetical protein [Atopobiaceae bacterium]